MIRVEGRLQRELRHLREAIDLEVMRSVNDVLRTSEERASQAHYRLVECSDELDDCQRRVTSMIRKANE